MSGRYCTFRLAPRNRHRNRSILWLDIPKNTRRIHRYSPQLWLDLHIHMLPEILQDFCLYFGTLRLSWLLTNYCPWRPSLSQLPLPEQPPWALIVAEILWYRPGNLCSRQAFSFEYYICPQIHYNTEKERTTIASRCHLLSHERTIRIIACNQNYSGTYPLMSNCWSQYSVDL